MILEKHFVFNPNTGCVPANLDDIKAYVNAKVTHFKDYQNWISKNEHISLFQELLNMVAEDIQAPDIDASPISHILYYNIFDPKKIVIYFDLVFILGTIAYNVFDYGDNALNHTEDGQHGAINMSKMIAQGYNELVTTKRINGSTAYGSTLIFTTVIEAELKRKFKWIVIEELVASVESRIQNGSYNPTADDIILIDCLKGHRTDYNSVFVFTEGADQLFTRANVYDPQHTSEQRNLMLNKTTLNQLLQSYIFSLKAEPAFLEIMKLIFGTNSLNLRNDIAHGGHTYQNYYHTAGAGLLYLLLFSVVNDFWKM